jgi:hypothetical protein
MPVIPATKEKWGGGLRSKASLGKVTENLSEKQTPAGNPCLEGGPRAMILLPHQMLGWEPEV